LLFITRPSACASCLLKTIFNIFIFKSITKQDAGHVYGVF